MQQLYAGYAKADITPDYPINITGYGDEETRISQGVRDPICLTCIAVRSEDKTLLLFDADLLSINGFLSKLIYQAVSPATGVPAEHIFCGATHTHSAPLPYGDLADVVRFRNEFLDAAVKAAQEAIADLAPTTMNTTTKVIKGMNFVRHYLMEDGSYAGSNFGNEKLTYIEHAGESDPRMLLIQFAREDKPDIVMMNWQAHNDNVYDVGYRLLSSSYTGQIRAKFEAETGMQFAFFMGASGNQNAVSRIKGEDPHLNYIAYGEKMAQFAIEAMQDMKPVTGSGIETKRVVFQAPVDHSWDHMLKEAEEVYRVWKTEGKPAGDALGQTYGFTSSFQAGHILGMSDFPDTIEMTLNAFRIGDMGFVTSPNEVFSNVGIHVRLHGPFENTFIITGNAVYLPCMAAYEYRSYESDTGLYAKGTAEKVSTLLVEMLEDIQ